MKTLLLVRHAKSDWKTDYDGDRNRPLSRRGRQAAALLGRYLRALDQAPDLVISSPAVRALRTVELAARAGEWACPIRTAAAFYEEGPERVVQVVRQAPDACRRLLVAGHEPIWSETAGRLVGDARLKMVTAATARIDFDVESWAEVGFGRGTLAWLVTPKLIGRAIALLGE